MLKYVAGFLFSPDRKYVCMVIKNKPDWQRGKYNAIGGKVEALESSKIAMSREFLEETGLYVPPDKWEHKVTLKREGQYKVKFFTAVSEEYSKVRTMEEEHITIIRCESVWNYDTIPNIRWLLPLCMDPTLQFPIKVNDIEGN